MVEASALLIPFLAASCRPPLPSYEGRAYLIVAPEALLASVADFAAQKASRGFLVETVALEEILGGGHDRGPPAMQPPGCPWPGARTRSTSPRRSGSRPTCRETSSTRTCSSSWCSGTRRSRSARRLAKRSPLPREQPHRPGRRQPRSVPWAPRPRAALARPGDPPGRPAEHLLAGRPRDLLHENAGGGPVSRRPTLTLASGPRWREPSRTWLVPYPGFPVRGPAGGSPAEGVESAPSSRFTGASISSPEGAGPPCRHRPSPAPRAARRREGGVAASGTHGVEMC